jgi:hypothetical protein
MPAHVAQFLESALDEEPAPQTFKERNWRQVLLAERLRGQYDVDPVDALIWVSKPYRARFPQ